MINLHSVILFTENPKKLVDFYKKIFQTDPDWTGGDFTGFTLGGAHLYIGPHDKVHGKSKKPERIIVNFETIDFDAEFDRIKGLGVTVIKEPYNPTEDQGFKIGTFADPDNNFFQLTTEMKK